MTPEQIPAFRTALLAATDPALQAAVVGRNDTEVARLVNLNTAPAFIVNRTSLTRHELITGTSPTGTTFTWGGATGGYINRSQGERDAFREMFNSTGAVNPGQTNIQTAFNDIFSGAGAGAVANRAHILAFSKRTATVAERMLATGTGSDASPGTLTFEGKVTIDDVGRALTAP